MNSKSARTSSRFDSVEEKQLKRRKAQTSSNRFHHQGKDYQIAYNSHAVIPPIVRTDIRERYPFLVAHVYNSTSYDLVWKLLSTYFRVDMVIAQELSGKLLRT